MLFRSENPVADAEAYYNYLEDNQPEEEEPEFVGYCSACREPITEDDDYIEWDAEIFCENCIEELVEYIVTGVTASHHDGYWKIRDNEFRIGADINDRNGDITYQFSTALNRSGSMEKEYFDTFVDGVEEVSNLIKKGVI